MQFIRTLALLAAASLAHAEPPAELSGYNVVWSTPGPDASASMPIGNGEVGANVWTEPNGDLLFYISRADAWSEASRLLKLARVRISLSPGLVQPQQIFRQELDLLHGCIHLSSGTTKLTLFVDSDYPTINIIGSSSTPTDVKVSLELWRTERTRLTGNGPDAELTSSWTMHDAPPDVEVWESADQILEHDADILWCHRNESSIVPFGIKHQGLDAIADSFADPLINRTFGGSISAAGSAAFNKTSPTALQSAAPVTSFNISVTTHCMQAESIDEWRSELANAGRDASDTPTAKEATEDWWAKYWSRSYIFVDGDRVAGSGVPANNHPIRLGQDSSGGNRFRGELGRVGIHFLPLSDVRSYSQQPRDEVPKYTKHYLVSFDPGSKPGAAAPDSAKQTFTAGFAAEAWIKPAADLDAARILDKLTAGHPDGFLFDIQPGATLRFIVGEQTLTAPGVVKRGEWSHVAATYDPTIDRLTLFVDGKQVATSRNDDAPTRSLITRGYILQRWIQACGWGGPRGMTPIKFNGSIFTVDAKHTNPSAQTSPDYRRWGDCFWWQNTRLPYHPMLAAGDFEMMDPLFIFYSSMVPACEERARIYHNVSGVYFPETVALNGLYSNGDYGWNRQGHESNEVLCPWWQWAWNQGTELVSLLLDRYDYTQDEEFARLNVVPLSTSVLKYFDTRFKRDDAGKLVISPTQSLETYWNDVINDMPCVAGLHDILPRLLALPQSVSSAEDRELWKRLHDALPPISTRTDNGVRLFSPAEKYGPKRFNCETPELTNVFPHRLVGLASSAADLEAARQTYPRRHDKATHGWTQDGQFAALLGLTDEAKSNILAKARNSNPRQRFPAMWGPNFDWLPDQCHGSNLMHVLQCMLLQPVDRGDKILLFPAWPKEWNVSFKLHAPKNTLIECDYSDGKVTRLQVTPESRRQDIKIMLKD